jgi:hypothetical protein
LEKYIFQKSLYLTDGHFTLDNVFRSVIYDLRACIEDCMELVAARAAEKSLNQAYSMEDGTLSHISVDTTRLRQILVNLLGNAVKFTETGKVVGSVSSRAVDGEWFQVHISVKDTGIGISQDGMNRLFQSFSQIDASTTRKYGGTGLGLAVSERMDGNIWRECGKCGLYLPLHDHGQESTGRSPPYQRLSQPSPEGKRILAVGENETNRRIRDPHLRGWGMVPVRSTLDAGNLMKRSLEEFDATILDLLGVDDLSLIKVIRERKKDLPILVLTFLGLFSTGEVLGDICLLDPAHKAVPALRCPSGNLLGAFVLLC